MNDIQWTMALDGWHAGHVDGRKVAEIRELPDGAWWQAGATDWTLAPTLDEAINAATRAVMRARLSVDA